MRIIHVLIFYLAFTIHIFSQLNEEQMKIHSLLCKIALQETTVKNENRFAISLRFKTNERFFTFLITNYEHKDLTFRSLSLTTNKYKDTYPLLHDKLFNCTHEMEISLHNKGFEDSEYHCIMFFETYKDAIINAIKEKLEGQEITAIELHGFTSRDMCYNCFNHMNLYCGIANQSNWENENFWKELKTQFKCQNIAVKFYVTSLIKGNDSSYDEQKDKSEHLDCVLLRQQNSNLFENLGYCEDIRLSFEELNLKDVTYAGLHEKWECAKGKKKDLFENALKEFKNLNIGLHIFNHESLWEQNFDPGFYTCLTQPNFLDQINQTIPTIKQSSDIVVNISDNL